MQKHFKRIRRRFFRTERIFIRRINDRQHGVVSGEIFLQPVCQHTPRERRDYDLAVSGVVLPKENCERRVERLVLSQTGLRLHASRYADSATYSQISEVRLLLFFKTAYLFPQSLGSGFVLWVLR